MRTWNRRSLVPLCLALALLAAACSSIPACVQPAPDLSPKASMAFQNTRVLAALDLLRDTAIAANAQIPPLLSEDSTRVVVTYHRSVITMINAVQTGWQATALAGIDEVMAKLAPSEQSLLEPYVPFVKALIREVIA